MPAEKSYPDACVDLIEIEWGVGFLSPGGQEEVLEILRVLKPGGLFAASDWLAGENADALPDYKSWRALSPHSFTMQTAPEAQAALERAGFVGVSRRDRNQWYVQAAMREVRMTETEWRDQYLAIRTEEEYRYGITLRLANARAAECGGLGPTHLFGRRAVEWLLRLDPDTHPSPPK